MIIEENEARAYSSGSSQVFSVAVCIKLGRYIDTSWQ